MRVDRQLRPVEGEQQHAGGRLASHARQALEELDRLLARRVGEEAEVEAAASRASIAPSIALIRCDLTFEMPPGRIASSISATGAAATGRPSRGNRLAAAAS